MMTVRSVTTRLFIAANVAACAHGPTTQVDGSARIKEAVPRQIGAFKLVERHEMRPAGTGTMHRFRDSTAVILSVILYDAGSRMTDYAGDPHAVVASEGRLFFEVMDIQVRRRIYRSYAPLVARPDSVIVGQRIVYGYLVGVSAQHSADRKTYEIEYVHLVDRTLVKVRVTIPEEHWPRPDMESFVTTLITALISRR